MVDITFLEVHVQDASFTKGDARDADEDVAFEAAEENVQPESGSGSTGAVVAALVGLVFLAVVAYLVKTRFLSDEEEEEYEFDSYD
ncbi:hypothetical protein [Haloglomus litoreum]|uniref:hypothetical protein n=1 Tax=Haloglomus litoreum TaxID=3034026 RepID=UPI0023E75E1E|nr:hypothetical protein [Haloglomus sp. DT116]